MKTAKEEYNDAINNIFKFSVITQQPKTLKETAKYFFELIKKYNLAPADIVYLGKGEYTTKEGFKAINAAKTKYLKRINKEAKQ